MAPPNIQDSSNHVWQAPKKIDLGMDLVLVLLRMHFLNLRSYPVSTFHLSSIIFSDYHPISPKPFFPACCSLQISPDVYGRSSRGQEENYCHCSLGVAMFGLDLPVRC